MGDKIPLLDMKAQLAPIRKEIDKAIAGVIDKGSFILGEEVGRLEDEARRYCRIKYATGVSNGTDAITLALEALGIGSRDRVICPSFTYYATAGAVARLGIKPVFVDIDPKTYCIDPVSVEAYFRRASGKERSATKAIIPVHLYGQCADMKEVLKLARRYNLKVIEDTAQAFGASYKGKEAGTMGDCSTVSFFPGKNLGACGDAGMVLTNNRAIADKVRILRNQGADFKNKYKHIYLGHNNRLDAIQATILRVKLKFLDRWNRKRRENASYYNKRLKDSGLITPYVSKGNTHTYHQYVLKARNRAQRDRVVDNLKKKGIDSRVFYPVPLHLQPCFKYLRHKKGDLPVSEQCAESVFSIPVYPELTKKQMDYIVKAIISVK